MSKSVGVAPHNIVNKSGLHWRHYYEMTKPKVVMLLLLTALVGMCLASETWISWKILLAGLTGIGFLSSAAAKLSGLGLAPSDHKPIRLLALLWPPAWQTTQHPFPASDL